MELEVTTQLNPTTKIKTTFGGEDAQMVIKNAGWILDYDGKCGMCNGNNVTIRTRLSKDKSFKFTSFVCLDCGGELPLGQNKDGVGMFQKEWQPAFSGSDVSQNEAVTY